MYNKGDEKIGGDLRQRVFNKKRITQRHPHSFWIEWIPTVLSLHPFEQWVRQSDFVQPRRRHCSSKTLNVIISVINVTFS